jgi:hypothetical protein
MSRANALVRISWKSLEKCLSDAKTVRIRMFQRSHKYLLKQLFYLKTLYEKPMMIADLGLGQERYSAFALHHEG